MSAPPLLTIRDLHAYYGKSHILQGVTFDVREGEIVAMLGRNGVGRSTALKAIMGGVRPQGQIRFKDREIAGLRPHEIARLGLGYVPEERAIFPALTVRQNLLLGMKGRREDGRWRMADMFGLFPPPRGAGRYPGRRAVGRRAADADDLPNADGRSGPHHDRRAD